MWDLVGNPEDRFSQNEAHFEPLQNLMARFVAVKSVQAPQKFITNRSDAVVVLWLSLLLAIDVRLYAVLIFCVQIISNSVRGTNFWERAFHSIYCTCSTQFVYL